MADKLAVEDAQQIMQGVRNLCQQNCAREVTAYVLGEVQYHGVETDGFTAMMILNTCRTFEEFERALKGFHFWPK